MNYPNQTELSQIERWANDKLAPRMVEAMKFQNGLVEKVDFLKRGIKIVEFIGRARNVQKEIKNYDNYIAK